jgi:FKBP-type peptidyl-prolyl cis-trans isomerase SlyD
MTADATVAVAHVVARLPDRDDLVVETTDVDVALESGLYEAHRDYKPLELDPDSADLPAEVADALREMAAGDERTVVLGPDSAFGRRRESAVVAVDRAALEERSDVDAEPDRLVAAEDGSVGWITAVEEGTVTVDFNHELAGERVAVDLRVLEWRPATDEGGDG